MPITNDFMRCAERLSIESVVPDLFFHTGLDYNATVRLTFNHKPPENHTYFCMVAYEHLQKKAEAYPFDKDSCPIRVSKLYG